jgi:hypothetical protein
MLYGMQDLAKNMMGSGPGVGKGEVVSANRESLRVDCESVDGNGRLLQWHVPGLSARRFSGNSQHRCDCFSQS